MESIGDRLRTAREARRLSVKDVVKETNISPHYIEALEEEDFDRFPSETYIIGFLRNYSEFLKIDPDEIIQSYKGYKIGESATPLEELTRPTRPSVSMMVSNLTGKYKNVIFVASIVLGVLILFWGVKKVFTTSVDVSDGDSVTNMRDKYNPNGGENRIKNIQNFQLSNDQGFILVSRDEAVQFLIDNKEVVFLLKEIKVANETAYIELHPSRRIEALELEKPKTIKLDGFLREVTFTLKGLTDNRAKILVVLAKQENETARVAQETSPAEETVSTSKVETMNNKNLKIVFEAAFVEKSFIEIYLDGVQKQRGFMPAGQKERWEATEHIQIKIGNAGGIKARINGKDYIFGRSGQVANKVITWKKDVNNPNLYQIQVNDW